MQLSHRPTAILLSALLATGSAFALAACAVNPLEAAKQGIEQQVRDTIKDQTGVDLGSTPDGQLPEGFPDSIPLLDGEPRSGSSIQLGDSHNWTVTFVGGQPIPQAVDRLKNGAEARGFAVGVANGGDGSGLVMFDNDEFSVIVNLGVVDGATHATFLVTTLTKSK